MRSDNYIIYDRRVPVRRPADPQHRGIQPSGIIDVVVKRPGGRHGVISYCAFERIVINAGTGMTCTVELDDVRRWTRRWYRGTRNYYPHLFRAMAEYLGLKPRVLRHIILNNVPK